MGHPIVVRKGAPFFKDMGGQTEAEMGETRDLRGKGSCSRVRSHRKGG